ncbi:response regulator [Confluentibacter lentus]|uniref:response regulator n=1 Tax=Confluentibacter lentus TaxID=1699412 RepID=UPI000C287B66|nr:response regulator [Confluentibacter lentus]
MIPIRNIMLVDDNKIDLFVNKKVIETYDKKIRVIHFERALSALEYLKISLHEKNLNYTTRPNVMFLDINMPQCNGFEFLDALEKQGSLEVENLRIIMLSSSSSPDDIYKALRHPLCSGYINKALTVEKLHEMINIDKKEYLTKYDFLNFK